MLHTEQLLEKLPVGYALTRCRREDQREACYIIYDIKKSHYIEQTAAKNSQGAIIKLLEII